VTNRRGVKGHVGGAAGLLSNPSMICGFSGREKKMKILIKNGRQNADIENANDWSLFFWVCL